MPAICGAQPVEQGFAHAIRRGPQARRIRKGPFPAAQGAADDAQFPDSTLHARKPITMRGLYLIQDNA